jgi:hypothetical protein
MEGMKYLLAVSEAQQEPPTRCCRTRVAPFLSDDGQGARCLRVLCRCRAQRHCEREGAPCQHDAATLFTSPAPTLTLQVKTVELKKLVYTYLVHYADANPSCRELALLAISSYQRDLGDSNQLIRALALRVLCSIRVREIVQIQILSVKKASSDK